ncbi:MAG: UDP-N-acetylmuramoyl-L-alanyl-D-glutamate--2,6-diaminopimelate ligase [Oscillospiraceae bacterium]|nr:UDP-N-acetylmuramoyl-L-alanyl-D-glutamate--2,6-diaminopimelate ligase [Oscillospiraceae bacterium]
MKLREVIKDLDILGGSCDLNTEIRGVCYDSRRVQPGDLFVAVRGFETDGHRYIPMALEKGAAAVLCEELQAEGAPCLLVADGRLALALASRAFFGDPAGRMTVIGLTGTNGKTTSSYLIKHMLEQELDAKVGLIGTNGIMIGETVLPSEHTTPESYELQKLFYEMAEAGCTHVVMEVSSHSLALERVAGIRYAVGVYTNLTQDHLDFHGTMEEYASAKRLLFRQCSCAWINADDGWADFMMQDAPCPIRRFSAEHNDAELVAKDIRLSATGVRFAAVTDGDLALARLAIPGMFSVHNALGVMAVGLSLGLSLAQCAHALETAKGVKGRVESVPTDGNYAILIDYAHTPDALENVLKTLKSVTKGRLIALFGCGGDRDRGKRPLMGQIAENNADLCIVTSDNPRTEDPEAIIRDILSGMKARRETVKVIPDRVEAIHWAIDAARDGDVIVLAGKGHEDYQVIGKTKQHMDEREIVAEYIERRKRA